MRTHDLSIRLPAVRLLTARHMRALAAPTISLAIAALVICVLMQLIGTNPEQWSILGSNYSLAVATVAFTYFGVRVMSTMRDSVQRTMYLLLPATPAEKLLSAYLASAVCCCAAFAVALLGSCLLGWSLNAAYWNRYGVAFNFPSPALWKPLFGGMTAVPFGIAAALFFRKHPIMMLLLTTAAMVGVDMLVSRALFLDAMGTHPDLFAQLSTLGTHSFYWMLVSYVIGPLLLVVTNFFQIKESEA